MELLAIASMFLLSTALGLAAARLTLSAVFYSMARASNRNRRSWSSLASTRATSFPRNVST